MIKSAIEIGLACLLSAGVALGVNTSAKCANANDCGSPAAQVQVVVDGVGDFTADLLAQLKGAFKADPDASPPDLPGSACDPCNDGGGGAGGGGGGSGGGGGGDDGSGIGISVDIDTQPLSADVDADVDVLGADLDAEVDTDLLDKDLLDADLSAVLEVVIDECSDLFGLFD